jgi:predicted XRE-type DNA-binding protein
MKTPKQLIEEIVKNGLRQIDIVKATGMSRAFVSDLANNEWRSMDYKSYAALVELHQKVMRQKSRKERKPKREPAEAV